MRKLISILTMMVSLALLSACGGTDSSSTSSSASSPATVVSKSVNLSWLPPTTRADGTYVDTSELAGYRIYMGTSAGSLSPIVDLLNDETNRYEVENLTSGRYYFAISTYDSDGVESYLSEVILVELS